MGKWDDDDVPLRPVYDVREPVYTTAYQPPTQAAPTQQRGFRFWFTVGAVLGLALLGLFVLVIVVLLVLVMVL